MSVPVIEIVCTDRGQHPSRKLGERADHRRVPFVDGNGREWRGFLPTDYEPRAKAGGYTGGWVVPDLEAFCGTCGRNVQMRESTLGRVVDEGVLRLDISALPF